MEIMEIPERSPLDGIIEEDGEENDVMPKGFLVERKPEVKMLTLMKQLNDRQKFLEEVNRSRDLEIKRVQTTDLPPVFNKRLFSAQSTVVITPEAQRIMEKTARHLSILSARGVSENTVELEVTTPSGRKSSRDRGKEQRQQQYGTGASNNTSSRRRCSIAKTSRKSSRMFISTPKAASENSVQHYSLTKSELCAMRCVVDGFHLIHKNLEYVKDVLAHVVTMETYAQFQYLTKKTSEDTLSCYYITQGSVEVTYDTSCRNSVQVYEPNIIYSHGAGEYLGLVSSDSMSNDLSPPASVYAKEDTTFLKIDRDQFHKLLDEKRNNLMNEKWNFIQTGNTLISELPKDTQDKIVSVILKQEFGPNRTIIHQDEQLDYIYFLAAGHCVRCRKLRIADLEIDNTFDLGSLEIGDVFGEECFTENTDSMYTILTKSPVICYKLHRSDFEIHGREALMTLLRSHRFMNPEDEELVDLGCDVTCWNNYKLNELSQQLAATKRRKLRDNQIKTHLRDLDTPPNDLDRQMTSLSIDLEENHPRTTSINRRVYSQSYIDKKKIFDFLLDIRRVKSAPADRLQKYQSQGHAITSHRKSVQFTPRLIMPTISNNATSGREPSFSSSSPTTLNDSGSWAGSGILHRRSSKTGTKKLPSRKLNSREIFCEVDNSIASANMRQDSATSSSIAEEADDLVTKARKSVEEYSKTISEQRQKNKQQNEIWMTDIHSAHLKSKQFLALGKFRVEHLKRKMARRAEKKLLDERRASIQSNLSEKTNDRRCSRSSTTSVFGRQEDRRVSMIPNDSNYPKVHRGTSGEGSILPVSGLSDLVDIVTTM